MGRPTLELTDPRNTIALIIAFVSVLGAIAAWQASVKETDAATLYVHYSQELVQQELQHLKWDGDVHQDLRFFAKYQAHIRGWRWFEERAAAATTPQERAALDGRAQAELALARFMLPYFRALTPEFGDEHGQVTYDAKWTLEQREAHDVTLQRLRPQATVDRAKLFHSRAVWLDGDFAVFVFSLLLLTVASVRHARPRDPVVLAGAAVAALGLVGLVLLVVVRL